MATAVITKEWRSSQPDRVEADLAALWRDLARESPVSRALLANLVIFCHQPASASVDLTEPLDVPVEEVAQRHPSRVIVLHHDPAGETSRPPIAAGVGVLMFGAAPSRFGVEQIVVRSASAEASLPSIVRRLTLGSVPISIWWTDDLSSHPPLGALAMMGRQLIYDSSRWSDARRGFGALQPFIANPHAPDLADLNWQRLSAVRQALVHAAESTGGSFDDVTIRHRPEEAALAWLLAGWLEAEGAAVVHVEQGVQQPELLTVNVRSLTATLTSYAAVARSAQHAAPFVVTVPRRSVADSVAAALRALQPDRSYRRSLEALIRRFATSRESPSAAF